MLLSVGGREAHTQPSATAYLSLTYTHCSTYIAEEQTSTFTACACMCVLHVWCIENRVHLFRPNVFSVIRMTESQMNLTSLVLLSSALRTSADFLFFHVNSAPHSSSAHLMLMKSIQMSMVTVGALHPKCIALYLPLLKQLLYPFPLCFSNL